MRMLFLFAVVSFLGCSKPVAPTVVATAPPAVQLDVAKLQALENLDLRDLDIDDHPELASLFAPFRHPVNPTYIDWEILLTKPWYIWKYEQGSEKLAWLLFMGKEPIDTEDDSAATLHFLDAKGTIVKTTKFSTGNILLSAEWFDDSDLLCRCLDVRGAGRLKGDDIARRVYTLRSDQLILLWAENSKGKIIPRMFAVQSTYPSIQKEAEFEQYLNSPNPVHVCEALWLLTNGDYEILQQPQILARILALSESQNYRLKTLAQRVLKSIEKRPNAIDRYE